MTDYLHLLRERGDFARQLSVDVPAALQDPNLTLDQATKLYQLMEQHAQGMERLVEALGEAEADDLLAPAEALSGVYDELTRAAAMKMISLRNR